ncbi:MAG: cytochrome c biogenesis protein ResB [Planctomycetota bacterium]|nr:cytochrome c biogenesis protein ResB [Planctomycetota bacterium]
MSKQDSSGTVTEGPAAARANQQSFPALLMNGLSSFGLTCIILLCLMWLTYWGTRMQEFHSLTWVVAELFESWICVIPLSEFGWGVNIRGPGAQLLLSLLAVNIICGGLVRMRFSTRTIGIVITHVSVLFLLLAGLVQQLYGTRGHMRLEHGEKSAQYDSFDQWELVIGELRADGSVREHLVQDTQLARLPVLRGAGVPFEIAVTKYFVNSDLGQSKTAGASDDIDGVYLTELPLHKQANFPGTYLEVRVPGEKPQRGLLWGLQRHPWTVEVKGVKWFLDLRARVFDLPFEIQLEKFRKEDHPGIDSPRHFSSDVVKLEDGVAQGFHISMNEPMRYGGFMFSQNNWGPQPRQPGQPPPPGPTFTVLEVSSNPADRWQMYAFILIGIGLAFHFLNKLVGFFKKMNKLARGATA